MNEQEILTQLRKAAEEIEIPEALKSEQIENNYRNRKQNSSRKIST